jgi:hypothetical protein
VVAAVPAGTAADRIVVVVVAAATRGGEAREPPEAEPGARNVAPANKGAPLVTWLAASPPTGTTTLRVPLPAPLVPAPLAPRTGAETTAAEVGGDVVRAGSRSTGSKLLLNDTGRPLRWPPPAALPLAAAACGLILYAGAGIPLRMLIVVAGSKLFA